jgi:molecular chaperone HtpG
MEALERMALMRQLHGFDEPVLYGKLISLRAQIGEWLGYIPATFPHYTRHTIGHSDEIVRQISSFLFEDQDWRRPVLSLSAAEIYAVVAAAYLHDAGMVASEREKSQILASSGWTEWVNSGSGARRWNEIKEMRSGVAAGDSPQHFLADLQVRFLIAEYIRRNHSIRAASFLEQSNELFTTYYFPEPAMLRAVADICIGHGLDWRELENPERYPLRRDVAEGPMNVRLLAILLRLGDLLDLAYDRACPLLLNAAAPLPYDSLANWAQYQRIVHRLTDPKRIEITAECATQDEHRVLRDWCQWIQDETEHAAVLIQGSNRHGAWRPPAARLSHPDATINIRPRTDATYIPVDWTFELDENTVFERLIVDAYQGPLDAIRELVQNAADANRCVLAQNLRTRGLSYSGWVEEEEKDALESLQIDVKISEVERPNDLSGELETKTIIKVEDTGIGMDRDVIQRYLLQVGRSYYTSRDFQQDFGFIPTSRFGIGFLSVFSVSDRVEVDTYKPSTGGQPLKLRLTGPKSYVLLDRGDRSTQGTSITLELREPVPVTALIQAVTRWCRRLEFPVIIQSPKDGGRTTITAEHPLEHATYQLGMESYRAVRYRAIPIKTSAARGEIYVIEVLDDQGKWGWDTGFDAVERILRRRDPLASLPFEQVSPSLCSHGMMIDEPYPNISAPLRIDYRKKHSKFQVGLGRISWGTGDFPPADEEVDEGLARIWTEHCDEIGADWPYRQRVADMLHLPNRILYDLPGLVKAFDHECQPAYRTLREVSGVQEVAIVSFIDSGQVADMNEQLRQLAVNGDTTTNILYILITDIKQHWVSSIEQDALLIKRRFKRIRLLENTMFEYLEIDQPDHRRAYLTQALLTELGEEHEDVLLIVSPDPHGRAYASIARVAINSRNRLFRELNQALDDQWEIGEMRLLSNSDISTSRQDTLSRVVEIMFHSQRDQIYSYPGATSTSSGLTSVLRSLAEAGQISQTAIEGWEFDWNQGGRLICRRGS